jgi:hypothetical protein
MQRSMTHNCMIKMDESFDNDIGFVLALFGVTVHECEGRADVIGADLPFTRIIGNVAKEEEDGIAATELEFLAFNPSGPLVEPTIRWSVLRCGGCVVRLVMLRLWAMTTGNISLSSNYFYVR